jgi:hypothetical protein
MPDEPVITAAINFKTVISPFAISAPGTASSYSLSHGVRVKRIRVDYVEKLDTKQQPLCRPGREGQGAAKQERIILFLCAA